MGQQHIIKILKKISTCDTRRARLQLFSQLLQFASALSPKYSVVVQTVLILEKIQ